MSLFEPPQQPNLRRIQAVEVELEGEPAVVLYDPAQPDPAQVVVSHAALALVSMFDGTRDVAALQAAFDARYGERPETAVVQDVIRQLDRALMLDSARYRADLASRLAAYRAQPVRPMILAPDCFPEDGEAAGPALDAFFTLPDGPGRLPELGAGPPCDAVVSPHIDYDRGAALYAQAYLRVAEGAADADLFVLLGTDHRGELDEPITLTRLDFETPFGQLRTDVALVEHLEATCGGSVVANELAHAGEHSLEFQAVMLHHVLGPRAAKARILPVLCGPMGGRSDVPDPRRPGQIAAFLEQLAEAVQGRHVCFIAGADLAHLGPTFQTDPLDDDDRQRLADRDRVTLAHLTDGAAASFDADVLDDENARQICSHTALHSLLRLVPDRRGELLGYRQCPAPEEPSDGSWVTIAALSYPAPSDPPDRD